MIFLRARYYENIIGRFINQDTWSGNNIEPISLDKWLYSLDNPIKMLDRTGNIPMVSDVDTGRAIYSCNCGWIDFGHANSGMGMRVKKLLDAEHDQFAQQQNDNYRTDAFMIQPHNPISIWGIPSTDSFLDPQVSAVVKTGIDGSLKDSVYLGIARALGESVERIQGGMREWFTAFSFEDLTSDEIGYYIALKYGANVDPSKKDESDTNNKAWKWLSKTCDYPENKDDAISNSQKVFRSYTIFNNEWATFFYLVANTPVVYKWDSPLLWCEVIGICDKGKYEWPSELKTITPYSDQRDGYWWTFNPNKDGDAVESSTLKNFYFLKKES